MAQVDISVDTTKKTIAVKVGGKKLPDVKEVYANQGNGYFDFSIYMVDETIDDLRKITRLSANSDGTLAKDNPETTGLSAALAQILQK